MLIMQDRMISFSAQINNHQNSNFQQNNYKLNRPQTLQNSMQDSIQLDQSDNEQGFDHNQFQFSSVISPKGRRLTKGLNTNTASHQSLAYSNSTYQKNQFTERSPPMFTMDNLANNQNVNTLNLRPFDRKQSTFGSGKGLTIQFDKIKEESYLSNLNEEIHKLDQTSSRERIDFPCFLSNENSPNNKFQFNPHPNDSLNQDQDISEMCQRKPPTEMGKKYTKITPSSRKQIKEGIVKSIKQKVDQRDKQKVDARQRVQPKGGRSTKLTTKSSKQSHEKSTHSLLSNESRRSKSPLQVINKSANSFNKNPDEVSALKQKIKELEYSLQVESISTEQLRAKVSVLNELLEEKFLERNGINFKLFKNSSPSIITSKTTKNSSKQKKHEAQNNSQTYSNIDLYVEMKVLQKAKQQTEIQYERLKNELAEQNAFVKNYIAKCHDLQKQLTNVQKNKNQIKTQTSFSLNIQNQNFVENHSANQKISQIQNEIENLLKQCDTQKQELSLKDIKITQLTNKLLQKETKVNKMQQYLKNFEEKEQRFTEIERPKFIIQIKDLTEKLDNHRQQVQKLEMENSLLQMQLEQGYFKDSKLKLPHSPEGKFSGLQKPGNDFISPQLSAQRCNVSEGRSQLSESRQQINDLIKQGNSTLEERNSFNKGYTQNGGIPDAMTLIMHQEEELVLLKNERDYFRQQNQQLKQMEKDNCIYKLEIEDLRGEVQSLRQIINLDDSCTF